MEETTMIILRLLLYLDLMLMFGLPFFSVYGLSYSHRYFVWTTKFRMLILLVIVAGLLLTGLNMLLVANIMAGTNTLENLTFHIIEMVIQETNVGLSWVIRLIALFSSLMSMLIWFRFPRLSLTILSLSGAVALMTLAWGGHAMMNNGLNFYIHLTSTLIHLLAAGTWVGALGIFSILLTDRTILSQENIVVLSNTLRRFSTAGSAIVVLLIISAIINYSQVSRGAPLSLLWQTLWGQLLLVKTGVFGTMLFIAGLNRLYFSPHLERAIADNDGVRGLSLIRRSVLIEWSLGLLVLALVAWLGQLSPSVTG